MFAKLVAAAVVVGAMAVEAQAMEARVTGAVSTVSWRGGYRYRRYSSSAAPARANYSGRATTGRSSPLDYPAYSQPYSTRIHQWNKYPNQPYYLRGERKSLLILP